jgi:hypothetical protein
MLSGFGLVVYVVCRVSPRRGWQTKKGGFAWAGRPTLELPSQAAPVLPQPSSDAVRAWSQCGGMTPKSDSDRYCAQIRIAVDTVARILWSDS